MKLAAFTIIGILLTSPVLADPGFMDDFNYLNTSNWNVSTWEGPGQTRNHKGIFSEENVTIVEGMLRLRVDQSRDDYGYYTSTGAELISTRKFGYGIYEFRMRAGSTADHPAVSGEAIHGSVSAAFIYESNVNTEIDIEFESNERKMSTHMLSWINNNYRDNQHTQRNLPGPAPYEQFYIYKIEWNPNNITFFRDDIVVAQHNQVVPSEPGLMIFNHWGSNSQWWGGWATQDVTRYVYIDYFKFTPLL